MPQSGNFQVNTMTYYGRCDYKYGRGKLAKVAAAAINWCMRQNRLIMAGQSSLIVGVAHNIV